MITVRQSFWITGFATLGIFYGSWIYISSPSGDQKVNYEPSDKECFEGGSQTKWRYCVHSAKQGTNGGIAYLFHGRNLDENTWNDDTFYTSLIQKYWADSGVKPPRLVTLSFGSVWLLLPKTDQPKSGLLDLFVKEVVPTVEAKIGIPTYRAVFGESMGGLNSLILALKTKGLFRRAIALCPAIYKGSPFSGMSEIRKFLHRTGADPKVIFGVRALAREYIQNDSDWKAISPAELVESVEPSGSPEIYLSAGLYDKYGNFEGSEYFVERAKSRGFKIHWRPLYGGHCAIDITSVADFLIPRDQ